MKFVKCIGLAVAFSSVAIAADWTYDATAKTITDGEWTLNVDVVSETDLQASTVKVQPESGIIDLSKPVSDGARSYRITKLGSLLFNRNETIKEVTLPEELEQIGGRGAISTCGTFYRCTALKKITPFLPKSVKFIARFSFAASTALEGDLVVGEEVDCEFENNGGMGHQFVSAAITSAKLGPGVTRLPPSVFANCPALERVELSDKFEKFEENPGNDTSGAFYKCSKLATVTPFLPKSLTWLGRKTFAGCVNLTGDLVLGGEKTCSIDSGGYQFSGVTKITSITLGKDVANLPDYVFADCKGVTKVTIKGGSVPLSTKLVTYGWSVCQTGVVVPAWESAWRDFAADTTKVAAMSESEINNYFARYPDSRMPVGKMLQVFPNQCLLMKNRPGTSLWLR